jgi:glyoxylase-like metal-dependent hydrolase (beta-lactamase superfamily II)
VGNAAAELSEVDAVRLGHAHTEHVGNVAHVNVWSNMKADL